MGSKTEMFHYWSKGPAPAPAAGAGAARASGEVAVQKVDRIDHVLISHVPSARAPVPGGGVRTAPRGGGRAAKGGDDIDRQAEEFIIRQRSMWALRQRPGGPSPSPS